MVQAQPPLQSTGGPCGQCGQPSHRQPGTIPADDSRQDTRIGSCQDPGSPGDLYRLRPPLPVPRTGHIPGKSPPRQDSEVRLHWQSPEFLRGVWKHHYRFAQSSLQPHGPPSRIWRAGLLSPHPGSRGSSLFGLGTFPARPPTRSAYPICQPLPRKVNGRDDVETSIFSVPCSGDVDALTDNPVQRLDDPGEVSAPAASDPATPGPCPSVDISVCCCGVCPGWSFR